MNPRSAGSARQRSAAARAHAHRSCARGVRGQAQPLVRVFDGAPDITTLGGVIADIAEWVGDRLLPHPQNTLALAAGWAAGS